MSLSPVFVDFYALSFLLKLNYSIHKIIKMDIFNNPIVISKVLPYLDIHEKNIFMFISKYIEDRCTLICSNVVNKEDILYGLANTGYCNELILNAVFGNKEKRSSDFTDNHVINVYRYIYGYYTSMDDMKIKKIMKSCIMSNIPFDVLYDQSIPHYIERIKKNKQLPRMAFAIRKYSDDTINLIKTEISSKKYNSKQLVLLYKLYINICGKTDIQEHSEDIRDIATEFFNNKRIKEHDRLFPLDLELMTIIFDDYDDDDDEDDEFNTPVANLRNIVNNANNVNDDDEDDNEDDDEDEDNKDNDSDDNEDEDNEDEDDDEDNDEDANNDDVSIDIHKHIFGEYSFDDQVRLLKMMINDCSYIHECFFDIMTLKHYAKIYDDLTTDVYSHKKFNKLEHFEITMIDLAAKNDKRHYYRRLRSLADYGYDPLCHKLICHLIHKVYINDLFDDVLMNKLYNGLGTSVSSFYRRHQLFKGIYKKLVNIDINYHDHIRADNLFNANIIFGRGRVYHFLKNNDTSSYYTEKQLYEFLEYEEKFNDKEYISCLRNMIFDKLAQCLDEVCLKSYMDTLYNINKRDAKQNDFNKEDPEYRESMLFSCKAIGILGASKRRSYKSKDSWQIIRPAKFNSNNNNYGHDYYIKLPDFKK